MDYRLLQSLISYLDAFQQAHPDGNLDAFVVWLNHQLFSPENEGTHTSTGPMFLAFKVMYLNKELKRQAKSVLSDSALSSLDEYSFLLHLDQQESFRKMELISLHNLEAPTGIEIIKRLLKNGLIAEFADPEDKRAKRIKITEPGRAELQQLQPQLQHIYEAFVAPLSIDEQIHLSGTLDKLGGLG